jgi:hypothetical protein
VIAGRDAVLEEEGGDTQGIEPAGDLVALVILGQEAVAAETG